MSDIELTQQTPRNFVGIRRKVNVTELPAFYSEVFPKVMGWLQRKGIAPASQPMSMWCEMDMETGVADTHAGCFVDGPVEVDGEVTAGVSSGGDVLKLVHRGSYDSMGKSWMRVYGHAKELGRKPGAGWEIYVDDPGQVAPDALRTEIYLPIE